MGARAEAVAETRQRIIEALFDLGREQMFPDISLDDVAAAADVSVQTILRHFRSRAGLIEATMDHGDRHRDRGAPHTGRRHRGRRAPSSSRTTRTAGQTALLMLAQESSTTTVAKLTRHGRDMHRTGCATSSRRSPAPETHHRPPGRGDRRLHLEAASARPRPLAGRTEQRIRRLLEASSAARQGVLTMSSILFVTWDGGGNVPRPLPSPPCSRTGPRRPLPRSRRATRRDHRRRIPVRRVRDRCAVLVRRRQSARSRRCDVRRPAPWAPTSSHTSNVTPPISS